MDARGVRGFVSKAGLIISVWRGSVAAPSTRTAAAHATANARFGPGRARRGETRSVGRKSSAGDIAPVGTIWWLQRTSATCKACTEEGAEHWARYSDIPEFVQRIGLRKTVDSVSHRTQQPKRRRCLRGRMHSHTSTPFPLGSHTAHWAFMGQ